MKNYNYRKVYRDQIIHGFMHDTKYPWQADIFYITLTKDVIKLNELSTAREMKMYIETLDYI